MHVPLVAFATRYLGDSARAEELVQDLFFALWQGRRDWTVTGSISAYLYAAARNRALNIRRRDAVEEQWADEESRDSGSSMHGGPTSPDGEADGSQLRARLSAAMDRLPARCALVMQMRWHGGLSYADIAETLGISVKGVENQLGRGLKALKVALRDR